ncbi:MAG TPA: hypothetical protein VFB58_07305 [Chloroflexota bacterium]|nr:hypothetical protein [Chloroflexota bacterium]
MNTSSRGTAVRVALGLLWLAFALTIVGAIVVAGYREFSIPLDVLVVSISFLPSIWALRRGRRWPGVALALLSLVLSTLMNFVEGLTLSEACTTTCAGVTRVDAVLAAGLGVSVLAFLACLLAAVRRPAGGAL